METPYQKLAKLIVHYSLEVKPGELFLVRSMSPAAEPLAAALYAEGLRCGAKTFVHQHIRCEDEIAAESAASVELLGLASPMLEKMYREADKIVRIDAPENPKALAGYGLDRQNARAKFHSRLISIQMEREGAGSLRRCSTQFPTSGLAQAAGMSLPQYEAFVLGACGMETVDPVAYWRAFEARQETLIQYLKGKKRIEVKGKNIELALSIEGRTFINCCGRINMPDGEIYTGPVEDSVEGWVRFTYPAFYDGNCVEGAELVFKKGVVVETKAKSNIDFLNSVLNRDAGARRLGEFAIGTNDFINKFTGSILFDEKIAGTVHMAVGQGYPKSGSVNQSEVHWDMICDMRDGGEIFVDGELFYKDGAFCSPSARSN